MSIPDDPTDEPMWNAYRTTVYEARTPEGVVAIRIGERHPMVDRLCALHGCETWCFVTAWNPGSKLQDEQTNQRAHEGLLSELRTAGFVFYEGVGRGNQADWQPEASLLVLGIGRAGSADLGRRWQQNAVVVGQRGGPAELVCCRD